jgi:hypothetical protein
MFTKGWLMRSACPSLLVFALPCHTLFSFAHQAWLVAWLSHLPDRNCCVFTITMLIEREACS